MTHYVGCNGGKISEKICFLEEIILVKRREIDFIKEHFI